MTNANPAVYTRTTNVASIGFKHELKHADDYVDVLLKTTFHNYQSYFTLITVDKTEFYDQHSMAIDEKSGNN